MAVEGISDVAEVARRVLPMTNDYFARGTSHFNNDGLLENWLESSREEMLAGEIESTQTNGLLILAPDDFSDRPQVFVHLGEI